MKLNYLLLTMLICLFTWSAALAQFTVTGTVYDEDSGGTLPGVNIILNNTTTGTVSDDNGNYSIYVPDNNSSLTFSFVGMQSQVIAVGDQRNIDVTLNSGTLLSEVVVTGFVPDRNARNITYANQTVKVDELLSLPSKNALEALRGKAAGVKINTGSGSVGASSRIVLRGESSLTGNNNALIVIDGVPIDNTTTAGGTDPNAASGTIAQDGYSDYGNRFNDINPNDIETMTVLKGPAATALYGSRGSGGVLLITTKSGKDGGLKFGVNSNYSRQKVNLILERQDQYGQGYDGLHFDSGENWSWGPAFDGVSRPWTSPIDIDGDGALEALVRPFSHVENQIEDFFQIGETFENSVFLSGGSNGFTYYGSYSNLNQTGVLENTDYLRNTFNFKATAKLSDKLSSNFGFNYSGTNLNTAQEGYRPFEGQNAYANAIQAPVNIPYTELKDYNNPYHDIEGYYGSYSTNPYFILNEYVNEGKFDNFMGNLSLQYDFTDDLNVRASVGLNKVNRVIETANPVYTSPTQLVWVDDLALTSRNTRNNSIGEYTKQIGKNTNIDVTLLGNYKRDINEDISFNVTAGYNLFDRTRESVTGATVGGIVVPGWYHFDNSQQAPNSTQVSSRYRLFGLLGNLGISYRNQIFLEYSARNDWSSTLPAEDNNYFYNGVGLSAVVSDMLNLQDNKIVNFIKLRGSFGTTGKDAQPHLLDDTFLGNPTIQILNNHDITTPLNGQPGFTVSDVIGNPALKPELTLLTEIGADIGLFDNRISFEYTYYSSNHKDQIIQVDLPSSSGFRRTSSNVGEMTNKGHELALHLRPIQGLVKDLKWNIDLIYSKNTNEVVKISDDIDELVVGGPYTNGSISIVAKEGLPFGTFKSTTTQYDANDKLIVGANGFPLLTAEDEYFGAYQPDFTASIGSDINFKGFGLNVLFDIRQGGEFLSITKNQTEFNGTALSTMIGDRLDPEEPFILDGVYEDGTPNTTEVTAQELYAISDVAFGGSSLLLDASFVKLRELGLNYFVPSKYLKNTPFSSANIGIYGSNFAYWLPDENTYADPEINGPGLSGNAVGVETTQTPSTKAFGVKVGLIF